MAASPATRPLVLAGLAAVVVAVGLYVFGTQHTPDYTTSLFGETGPDTFDLKSWLATGVLAFAAVQLALALWMYGRLPWIAIAPPQVGPIHRAMLHDVGDKRKHVQRRHRVAERRLGVGSDQILCLGRECAQRRPVASGQQHMTEFTIRMGFQVRASGAVRGDEPARQAIGILDIAFVQVIKGPASALIYGSRAANGAVIITTKQAQISAMIPTVKAAALRFAEHGAITPKCRRKCPANGSINNPVSARPLAATQ